MANPKCLAHVRICKDYHRGRCKREAYCSYKEKKKD